MINMATKKKIKKIAKAKKSGAHLKLYSTEELKIIKMKRSASGFLFAITNFGRVIRFIKIPKEGEFVQPNTLADKYPYQCVYFKRKIILVHRLVAQHFLPKPGRLEVIVIHKNRDLTKNHVSNLKWVDKQGHLEHTMKGENWRKAHRNNFGTTKLTEARVRMIRRKIQAGKTLMREIANQFGVTEMQIYRIKSRQNWAHVV